ncbi:MAG: DUF5711 family protein [Oscillospiraceae bacterium]|jgi:hypothetical protein|nr:DUF5711 family protein [Oscillospiraceae bacterium]
MSAVKKDISKENRSALRRLPGMFLRFIILAAVAGICLFVVMNYNDLSVSNVLSILPFGEKDTVDYVDSYKFTANPTNAYADYMGGLAVLSANGLSVINKSGAETAATAASFQRPSVKAAGSYLLAYDVGGVNMVYCDSGAIKFSRAYKNNIITCEINAMGWYLVVAEESGSKATAALYDETMEEVIKWFSPERYLTVSALSPDSARFCVGGVNQSGAKIMSKVIFMKRTSEEPYASYECYDELILDIVFLDNENVMILKEKSVVFCDGNGNKVGEQSFENLRLSDYSTDGAGLQVVCLSDKMSGSVSRVLTLNREGGIIAEKYIDGVKAISCINGSLGILTTDTALVYNESMEDEKSFSISAGSRHIIMRENGTLMILTGDSAEIYSYK